MIKKNKRAQFYLITSMVIIALILSFSAISNYVNKKNNIHIYNIRDELKIEGAKVLDYEVVSGEDKIENFTKQYSDYAGKDTEIYFITGNDTIEIYKYVDGLKIINQTIPNTGDELIFRLEGVDYKFKLKQGENFYFIISQKSGDENYVATG